MVFETSLKLTTYRQFGANGKWTTPNYWSKQKQKFQYNKMECYVMVELSKLILPKKLSLVNLCKLENITN